MPDIQTVRLLELHALDERELRDVLAGDDITFEEPASGDRKGTAHEPITTVAVVLLTAQALQIVAAWLLKRRHRRQVEVVTEVSRPDGSYERKVIKLELTDSSSQADVVQAVGEQLGVDASLIGNALKLAKP